MSDAPISYLALADGTEVRTASGGLLGTVDRVLQDDALDVFDGVVVRTAGGLRFLDGGRITRMTAQAVETSLSDDDAAHLPEPDGDAVLEADPADGEWTVRTDDDPGER